MACNTVTFNTEIRKLKPAHRYALGDILNVSDSWKKLMAIIPRSDSDIMRFTSEHISIVEQMARKYRYNAAEILLDEWGTMGRKRPTLQILLDLLIKAELFRAADYVASEILNVDLPQRPQHGPAAVIDISDETLARLVSEHAKLDDTEYSKSTSMFGTSCEVNAGEIKCFPDAIDLMDPCFSKNNSHADKPDKVIEQDLIKFSINGLPNKDITSNGSKSKDLIKFSTDKFFNMDITHNSKIVAKEEENSETVQTNKESFVGQQMSSQELPVFLNNFEQNIYNNNEVRSAELPVFLNQSSYPSNSSNNNSNLKDTEHEIQSVNYQLQTEITSSLLPRCIVDQEEGSSELYKTNDTNKNVAITEDLPLTVLEYNK